MNEIVNIDGVEWTDEQMRLEAMRARDDHDPANQEDNPYERCKWCSYTRHPCDVYVLASMVLALLDRSDDAKRLKLLGCGDG